MLVLVLLPALFADGGRPARVPVALGLALVKVVALGGAHHRGRRPRHPVAADAGRAHPVARAVHAGRPRHRPRHRRRRRRRSSACRWRSAPSWPAWSSAAPSSACAPPSDALPMRDAFAVLFFVSVGMLLDPGTLARRPAAAGGDAGHRPDRQAAGRAGHRRCCSAIRCRWRCRSRWRWRRSASSRSSSPRSATELGVLTADATNVARRGRDRLDHAQPAALPLHRLARALARPAARRPAEAPAPPADGTRAPGFAPPRHRRRLRPGRAHRDAAPARQRHRADDHRDERGHRPRSPRGGPATRSTATPPTRRSSARRGSPRRAPSSSRCRRSRASRRPAGSPAPQNPDIRILARATHVREARLCARPAPTSCSRARAKSRSPSRRRSSATSAPPPTRSIASAPRPRRAGLKRGGRSCATITPFTAPRPQARWTRSAAGSTPTRRCSRSATGRARRRCTAPWPRARTAR